MTCALQLPPDTSQFKSKFTCDSHLWVVLANTAPPGSWVYCISSGHCNHACCRLHDFWPWLYVCVTSGKPRTSGGNDLLRNICGLPTWEFWYNKVRQGASLLASTAMSRRLWQCCVYSLGPILIAVLMLLHSWHLRRHTVKPWSPLWDVTVTVVINVMTGVWQLWRKGVEGAGDCTYSTFLHGSSAMISIIN